jgi:hypothetical protein
VEAPVSTESIREHTTVPVRERFDVVVLGGGVAGCAAALAARRGGCRTLLIEKSVVLGGLATGGHVATYLPLCDGRGNKVTAGIAEELLRLSIRYGYDNLPAEWRDGLRRAETRRRYRTDFSVPEFALALDELLVAAGVDLLLDTLFCAAVMDGGTCTAVIVENKAGRSAFTAACCIDATGDADLAARCGLATAEQENWLSYWFYGTSLEAMERAVAEGRIERGIRLMQLGANDRGIGAPEGSPRYRGTDDRQVTQFVLNGRAMALREVKSWQRGKASLLSLPSIPQLRTTRRLVGRYTLSAGDVGTVFPDSIGCVGDWRAPGPVYEVPFRCLHSDAARNVLSAGRCISAEGDAWDVTRVIPGAAMTGQAAGTAAALAVHRRCAVQELDIPELQRALENAGVILRAPPAVRP